MISYLKMGRLLILICLSANIVYGQSTCLDCSDEWADRSQWNRNKHEVNLDISLSDYDFSNIYVTGEDLLDEGVYGADYQRISFYVFNVSRDSANHFQYMISGKFKLMGRYFDFKGTITQEKIISYGDDIILGDNKSFPTVELVGNYSLDTYYKGKITGKLIGKLVTKLNLNTDAKEYIFEENSSFDHFYKFVGIWNSVNGDEQLKCNWSSNEKIPYAPGFDIGTTDERVINKQYQDNGWNGSSRKEDWFKKFNWD